jgi:metallo-beta-lactamase class B
MFLFVILSTLLLLQTPDHKTRSSWNAPHPPFRIYGNTFYVGSAGLSAILIASTEGHVLVDGGLPESAPLIAANVRELGFRVEDIKWIVVSHTHFDHAGGVAELQQLSGAEVLARAGAARVLRAGRSAPDDPQYGVAAPFPSVASIREIDDRAELSLGPIRLKPHATAGHTPSGTSWSWPACEAETCATVVYADSLTPVSADGFRFTDSRTYPTAVADFRRSFAVLNELPCDILVTPHPSASSLFARVKAGSVMDRNACRAYAARATTALNTRIETERRGKR